jgi:hypothetical protein
MCEAVAALETIIELEQWIRLPTVQSFLISSEYTMSTTKRYAQ